MERERDRAFRRAGFTLVEVLLSLVLLLLLFGAMVFEFGTLGRGEPLEEATRRLESLIRFVRAESSRSGKRLRLRIATATVAPSAARGAAGDASATLPVEVLIELDPVAEPDVFSPLGDALWARLDLDELVAIESARVLGGGSADGASASLPPAAGAAENSATAITFWPDGSADSAEVVFRSRDADRPQRRGLRIVGITGRVEIFAPGAAGSAEESDAGADPDASSEVDSGAEATTRDEGAAAPAASGARGSPAPSPRDPEGGS